jgi:hypothetical protein
MATRKNRGKPRKKSGETQPVPVVPSYQEGSIDSIGGGPSGTDDSDRSGEGTLPAGRGKRGGQAKSERGRDNFVSTEVTDKTSVRGKDPRTRS